MPSSINMLDLCLGLLLIFFSINGALRGFLEDFSGLAGLALGILFTANPAIHSKALQIISPYVSAGQWLGLLAYFGVFILVFFMAKLVGVMLTKLLTRTGKSWLDHLLGLFSGLGKGFIACTLVLLCLYYIWPDTEIRSNSFLLPYINGTWRFIARITDGLYSLPDFLPPS